MLTISPNYRGGVFHIIDHYAKKLALLSSSLDQAIINARDFYAMYANNEQGAATLNAMMEARLSGKPFAVIDKKILAKEIKKEECLWRLTWLREKDLNQRPSGYEVIVHVINLHTI